jgi:tetratricopeptide (TPR) repeat protein
MKLPSKLLIGLLLPSFLGIIVVSCAQDKTQIQKISSEKNKMPPEVLDQIEFFIGNSIPAFEQKMSQASTPEEWRKYAHLKVGSLMALASKDKKESNYRQVITKLEPTLPLLKKMDDRELQARIKSDLAYAYTRLGEYNKAIPLYEESLSLTQTTHYSIQAADDRAFLAKIYLYKKDYAKSEALLKESLIQVNQQDIEAVSILKALGTLKLFQKDFKQAEMHTQKALKLVQDKEGEDSSLTVPYLQELGLVYIAEKRYQEAELLYRQALKIMNDKTQQLEAVTSYNNIGLIYHAQGDFEKAQAYYQKAQKLMTKTGANPDSPFYIRIKVHLDELAKKLPPTYVWDS